MQNYMELKKGMYAGAFQYIGPKACIEYWTRMSGDNSMVSFNMLWEADGVLYDADPGLPGSVVASAPFIGLQCDSACDRRLIRAWLSLTPMGRWEIVMVDPDGPAVQKWGENDGIPRPIAIIPLEDFHLIDISNFKYHLSAVEIIDDLARWIRMHRTEIRSTSSEYRLHPESVEEESDQFAKMGAQIAMFVNAVNARIDHDGPAGETKGTKRRRRKKKKKTPQPIENAQA